MLPPTTPGTEQAEAHLPPHERNSVTRVPVTPGVALGTYEKDYFTNEPNGTRAEPLALPGNIISVAFAIPHGLHYNRGSDWGLRRSYQRSALLDSLHWFSEESPWRHTVVAWTGEIQNGSEVDGEDATDRPAVAQASSALPLGGSTALPTKAKSNEIRLDRQDQRRLESQLLKEKMRIVPVWLADSRDTTAEEITLRDQSRWRHYAEHDLCALLHYKLHPPTDGFTESSRWADYCHMSQLFADKVCEVYRPGDIVFVHDYYLMLLPELLRQRLPEVRIAFFLHTPFPSSELVRCLTRRKDVLLGMLGSDLIAFQSFHYAQHFANSCSRILGLQASSQAVITSSSRCVQIGVVPAGINISKIHASAWSVPVTQKCLNLRKLYAGKKIIVAYDPIDRLGGVDKKLLAFDRFLEMYPEWRERVVLLQVISQTPIDDDDGEESRHASSVSSLVNSINCKYGSLDYMPIQLHAQSLSGDDYFALLRSGDVALFTSIRDGMSITSLEYVVCQQNTHGCTLISEFSGTASNLEEAIHINPWDTVGVARQIHAALNMTAEKRQDMHIALYRRITEKDVEYWLTSILGRLMKTLQTQRPAMRNVPAARTKDKRSLLVRALTTG